MTLGELKESLSKLTPEQLLTEACVFEELSGGKLEQIAWINDVRLEHSILSGTADFGQGYVMARGRKWSLSDSQIHGKSITMFEFVG